MGGLAAVTLPAGVHADGAWRREAVLAAMTGREEALLAEDDTGPLAHRVTVLLTRCLRRLGDSDAVSEDAVRGLRIGDREALLLHLTRLTTGERLERVVRCPAPTCGETVEFTLGIADLLRDAPAPAPVYTRAFGDGAVPVAFRLPTGADQEDAALSLAAAVDDTVGERLLRACLHAPDGRTESIMPVLRERLPPVMAELDPQAELWLDLTCPACGNAFAAAFDAAAQLAAELSGAGSDIFRQVHRLASAYHWSETEIMAMPRQRRQRYLGLLDVAGGERP